MNDGSIEMVQNPSNLPDRTLIDHIEEPMVKADIMVPKEYVGNIMEICQERPARCFIWNISRKTESISIMKCLLNEVIYDFFDALKSKTRGYGSLDYEFVRYEPSKVVKLDILLNKDLVDAFSMIVHESKAYSRGRTVCSKLKEIIPMHQFEVPIQASIGQKVIARETGIQKRCYCKVLRRRYFEKEKAAGKAEGREKRMRQFGKVEVPQEAFTAVLKYDDNK